MTHWKKLTNPNYLGAFALDKDKTLVLTIKSVQEERVIGTDGKKDDCVVCHFYENVQPMILNATNMKTITNIYKTPYIEEWTGKRIEIGTERVKAFGTVTDALRVQNHIPQEEKCMCDECGKEILGAGKMSAKQIADYTKAKYGKQLCSTCATAIANQNEVNNAE